eukprot:Pgem_evm1s19309
MSGNYNSSSNITKDCEYQQKHSNQENTKQSIGDYRMHAFLLPEWVFTELSDHLFEAYEYNMRNVGFYDADKQHVSVRQQKFLHENQEERRRQIGKLDAEEETQRMLLEHERVLLEQQLQSVSETDILARLF